MVVDVFWMSFFGGVGGRVASSELSFKFRFVS